MSSVPSTGALRNAAARVFFRFVRAETTRIVDEAEIDGPVDALVFPPAGCHGSLGNGSGFGE
jgi:hypothetical protein